MGIDGSEGRLSSVIRWSSVLLIAALFGADRFGGTNFHFLHTPFLASYLLLIFLAFGLPIAEGRTGSLRIDLIGLVLQVLLLRRSS